MFFTKSEICTVVMSKVDQITELFQGKSQTKVKTHLFTGIYAISVNVVLGFNIGRCVSLVAWHWLAAIMILLTVAYLLYEICLIAVFLLLCEYDE